MVSRPRSDAGRRRGRCVGPGDAGCSPSPSWASCGTVDGGPGDRPGHGDHHPDLLRLPGDGRDPGRHPARAAPPPATPTSRSAPCCARPGRTDWITEAGRAKLAAAGIAPPAAGPAAGAGPADPRGPLPAAAGRRTPSSCQPVRLHRVQGAVALPCLRRTLRPGEGAVTVTITRPVRRRPASTRCPSPPSTGSPTTRSRSPSPCRTELRDDVRVPRRPAPHRAARRGRRRTSAGRTRSAPRPAELAAARPAADRGAGDPRRRVLRATPCAALRGRRHRRGAAAAGPLHHARSTPDRARHYGAVVAGSGITPVLSLVATALAVEPASRSPWCTATARRAR